MRLSLTLAIAISIVLVGTASWLRFVSAKDSSSNIQLMASDKSRDFSRDAFDLYLTSLRNDEFSEQEPLTDTDLMGRQLLMDFLKLSSSNEDSDKNLQDLADFYSTNITNLIVSPKLESSSLTIVPTSKISLTTYAEKMASIYLKYEKLIEEALSRSTNETSMARTLSGLHTNRAGELKSLQVPRDMSAVHLKLTNNYLSSGYHYKILSEAASDPVRAFAAFALESEKETENGLLYAHVVEILEKYGI
jgi:hypothetical protein